MWPGSTCRIHGDVLLAKSTDSPKVPIRKTGRDGILDPRAKPKVNPRIIVRNLWQKGLYTWPYSRKHREKMLSMGRTVYA